jgi:deoxyribodipyrimidine photo-lyase
LDGDLASNHLSWQWVAGAFSNKKYVANQNNINTFYESSQQNTFLDVEYEAFENFETPSVLEDTVPFQGTTTLPESKPLVLDNNKTTLVYNYYNIDPYWYKDEEVQRIFLLEPSFYTEQPVSQNSLDFALALTKNIKGIQIFVGEFQELAAQVDSKNIRFKEHPTNHHYQGHEEPREWLSSVKGYYPSFFAFWKKCKKEL